MSRRHHRRISKAVDAFVDDELGPVHSGRVAAHLRDCWDCSSAAETARLVKRSLRGLGDRQPRRLAAARLQRFAEQLVRT